MVEGFVGLPGLGKTYYLSALGLKAMKKGRKVYANYKLDGAIYYDDLVNVFDVKEGVILVDEINLICPSRWWHKFPIHLAYWWSQTRKNQLDVYWTAQHQRRVDRIVKEITNFIWVIRKLPFGFRIIQCYLPEQVNRRKAEVFSSHFFRISKKTWSHFNTYERIDIPNRLSASPFNSSSYNKKKFWRKPKIFSDRMNEMDKQLGPDSLPKVSSSP
jgi:hypothetical protein